MTAILTAPAPATDAFTLALTSRPVSAPAMPTILIADDDADVREVLEFKLQVAGFRTLTADNGRRALDIAVDQRPRMIILDRTMPELDGLTVCHELQAAEATARIPVLMISGLSSRLDLDLGYAAGADDYLPKPFSQTEMLRRVNTLLAAGR